MKKLVLTALFCSGITHLASGCIIVDDESPATITASWSLVSGDNNDPAACPPGATTIALISEDPSGVQIKDLFDCDAASGMSGDLREGTYGVWLQLTDDSGQSLFAQSLSTDVQVFAEADHPIAFEISIDRGSFIVGWDVVDGPNQYDCERAGVTWFSLDYTDDAGGFIEPDVWGCDLYAGTSTGIPLEDWSVSPSFLDTTELAVEVGSSIDTSLDYGNHYNDIGVVVFDIQAPTVP